MLTERTRQTWASAAARDAWEGRLQEASRGWAAAEVESVKFGLRRAALVSEAVEGLPSVQVGNRWAVGPEAEQLAIALRLGDDRAVGRLLGFPECCVNFFMRTWAQGTRDTTWQMLGMAKGPIEANILGRWLGMRWVTHLPCSFQCEETVAIGQKMRALVPSTHAATIDEVLSWPVEWSALHGAAEIKYPVCKIVTGTGYTATKLIVRREGTRYPAEGVRGLVFPYRQTAPAQPLEFRRPAYTENGFTSQVAQDAMHLMVLEELRQHPPKGLTLDLGAGNGELMKKIAANFHVPVNGVEVDVSKTHQHPHIIIGDIRTALLQADTIVVSVRRFEEIEGLERRCVASARQVLAYSYDAPTFARVL